MPDRENLAQSVGPPLKILFIEDQHADFMLAYRYLIRQGLDCQCVRVDSTEALIEALDGAEWDLVLADCSLPRFDVSDALRLVRKRALDVPFILLSGVIGEEDAVDLLKAGAEDFVSKDNLSRLVPAIRRGMREAAEREESREARRRLSTLLGSLPGMAFRCRNDRAWTMEFVSEGCRDLLGYPPADLLGNQRIAYGDIICPADRELVWNAVQQAGRKGEPYGIEYRLIRGDGATRWVWEQGRLVSRPDDEPRFIEGFIMDVTERHEALSRLACSEERFKLAIEGAGEGLWDWNIVTDSVYYSPRWKSMLGCAQTRIGDRLAEWKARMHPDDLDALEQAIEACLQGETEQFERVFRLRHERGHYLWVWSRGRLIRGADGAPARLTGVQVDISERVKLEQALLNTLSAMQTLSQCNAAIARAGQPAELLRAVCGILTRVGQFELAWVEAPADTASGALQVQARACREQRFAGQLPPADQSRDGGAALADQVLRTGDSVYLHSAAGHPRFRTWRALIEEQGDFSYLALPIKSARKTVAVLNLCAWSTDNLAEHRQGPWLELADYLSFGLQALSTRSERERPLGR